MRDERNYGLDVYRILCCMGVLTYHIMDDVLVCGGGSYAVVFYFAASYCVPGFFLLSGYLLGQRERLSIEYVETKITEIMKKLFLWAVFWASAHFICTGEIIDLWGNITAAAGSGGILPTAWFLFTYCFLLLLGYPLQRLKQKQKGLFCTASMIWIVLLAFGFGSGLHDTRTQSLWLHLYAGYFCFGMSLSVTGGSISRIIPRKYGLFPVFLTGTAALAVYAVQVQAKGDLVPDHYYGTWYYSLWLVCMFWSCTWIRVKNKRLQDLLKMLSKNTVTVYLGHLPLLLYVTEKKPLETTWMAVLYIVLLFFGFVLAAELFGKMPLLRKLR